MHEYGITQNIVDIVVEEAQKNNVNKVTSIKLVIGELSGIIDESVQMYFDIISVGTLCEGAKLNFIKNHAMLECKVCSNIFKRNPRTFDCPKCGGIAKLTDVGKEFYIESIEVE